MGRGRGGRGKFGQSRPPPAIRSSMQELGMTATANYVGSISDVLGVSVDAARAYFPPLPEGRGATAVAPSEAEVSLLERASHLEKSLLESPMRADGDNANSKNCVASTRMNGIGTAEKRKDEKNVSELETMTMKIANYFLTSYGTNNSNNNKKENDIDLGEWIIPEMLPGELRPAGLKLLDKKRSDNANGNVDINMKKKKIDTQNDGLQLLNEEAENARPEPSPDADLQEYEDEELDEERNEIEENYVTGGRFDDDDGYEEADSGEEEPTM